MAIALCASLAHAQAPPDSTAAPSPPPVRRASHFGLPANWPPEPSRGRPDLYQHASLAFASGLAIGLLSESPAAAAGTSVTLGVGKELTDDHFDRTDLLADLVGAALAAVVTHWVTR